MIKSLFRYLSIKSIFLHRLGGFLLLTGFGITQADWFTTLPVWLGIAAFAALLGGYAIIWLVIPE